MAGWPEGVGRRVLPETDSTMAEAARRAAEAVPGPEWTLALRQTAGRGRRGRAWAMPEGNFAATLLMRPKGSAAEAAYRSFVAALALREAFLAVGAATADIALKWPNDVLFRGRKIAGILLESQGDGRGGVDHLAVGIGVNLAALPPPGMLEPEAVPPIALREATGIDVTPENFLVPLAIAFDRLDRQFTTYGFQPIRSAWLSAAARLGETITARTGNRAVTGVFRDVDVEGNLVLDTSLGLERVPAGEVFF